MVVNIFVLVRPTASKGRRRGKENFRTHAKLSRKKVSRVEVEKKSEICTGVHKIRESGRGDRKWRREGREREGEGPISHDKYRPIN